MRSSLLFSVILFSLIIFVIRARDILDEEEARDVQRYCEKYAGCRRSARQQFEKCAGGFSKMIVAQTDSLRIKPSSRSEKCEKQLLINIGSQIKPVYEKIEHDTFECTKSADPHAFNLDQSQTLICKAIQQEVGLDNFAISGAQSDSECRNTFESQMQRCDLVKECCPQFTHCHTKAELENNIYGKEERLALQLDECIGYKQGSPKAGLSGSYKHEDTRKAPPSTTPEPTTVVTEAAAVISSTFPPPDKVFSDLFKALFPGLAPPAPLSTTNPPTTTTAATSTESVTEKTTTQSIFDKVNEIIRKESGEKDAEIPPSNSQISQWKAAHDKIEQLKAKGKFPGKESTSTSSPSSSTKPFPTPDPTKSPIEIDFSHDSFPSHRRSRIHSAPLISKDSISLDQNQKESLSRVYCENLMECEAVVEKQFDLCDTRYQPEENLYGIEKQSLRSHFLSNSNVTDQKVKRRCLEAVDPESQRQLSMLESFVKAQDQKCTRKAQIPSITSDKFEQCQNVHLITVISEMFTNKDIPDERSIGNAEKCYARVGQLQSICDTIRKCCPQHENCVDTNHSTEGAKYRIIVEQLKEEQTLCEKRRMRILNGLV